jgi:murein DD-endopeptidase MepM/ murein hydrolase activator NlpD
MQRRAAVFSCALLVLLVTASRDDGAPPRAPARAVAPAQPPKELTAAQVLAQRRPLVPVQGVRRGALHDTFAAQRGAKRRHEAIDILAPRGTPVLAADDGEIGRISSNRAGGLAIYQVDASRRLAYYYAHLDGYAPGLREGMTVRRGDVLGYVGTTGNAPRTTPHLHFAVYDLLPGRRWWKGNAINPYEALTQDELVGAR